MAFWHFTVRPAIKHVFRFWPLFIGLFMAILYLFHIDLSITRIPCANDAKGLQSPIESSSMEEASDSKPLPYTVSLAMLHYATTEITPQQSKQEIMVTANILRRKAPCNFLIFGLGFDSLLWKTLNHGGNTVFLEEDPTWIADMARSSPGLRSFHVNYTTMLSQAEQLLAYARREKGVCSPAIDLLESGCKLAMKTLPAEVYGTEWDVIMVDAPKGYFAEAPGRMSAIYSSAVMAKGREKNQSTDILLHDVDRPVEKSFSTEFLCPKNRIEAVGRLWHFQIHGEGPSRSTEFC